jgi:hypothetical protein
MSDAFVGILLILRKCMVQNGKGREREKKVISVLVQFLMVTRGIKR